MKETASQKLAEPIVVTIRPVEGEMNLISLAFDDLVTSRNMNIHNAPDESERSTLSKYGSEIAVAVVHRWVVPPRLRGVESIYLRRHSMRLQRADLRFDWDSIVIPIMQVIRLIYYGRIVDFQAEDSKTGELKSFLEPMTGTFADGAGLKSSKQSMATSLEFDASGKVVSFEGKQVL